MTAKISALRGFTCTGASFLLRVTLGCSFLLTATSGIGWADPAPVEASEVTINPATGDAVLTLQGPAYGGAAAGDYGLTLSYHDKTSTDLNGYAVMKIYRPNGQ